MSKIWLIDIDGTICEDVPNEESHKFADAKPVDNAAKKIQDFKNRGDTVVFFTARTDDYKTVTEKWLDEHGFPYDSVIYNKPRIKDGQMYQWIDNKPVRAFYIPEGMTHVKL